MQSGKAPAKESTDFDDVELFRPWCPFLPTEIRNFAVELLRRIPAGVRTSESDLEQGLARLHHLADTIGHPEWLWPTHPAYREPSPMMGLTQLLLTVWNRFDPADHPEAANIRYERASAPDSAAIVRNLSPKEAAEVFIIMMTPFSVFFPPDERRRFIAKWAIRAEHSAGSSPASIIAARHRFHIEVWVGQLKAVLQPAADALNMHIDDVLVIDNLARLPQLHNQIIGANFRVRVDFFPLPILVRDRPELVKPLIRIDPTDETIAVATDELRIVPETEPGRHNTKRRQPLDPGYIGADTT